VTPDDPKEIDTLNLAVGAWLAASMARSQDRLLEHLSHGRAEFPLTCQYCGEDMETLKLSYRLRYWLSERLLHLANFVGPEQ
jgi:hypothetical protein